MNGNTLEITYFLIGLNRTFALIRHKVNEQYCLRVLKIIEKHLELLLINNNKEDFKLFKDDISNIYELDEYARAYFSDALNIQIYETKTLNIDEVKKYYLVMKDAVTELFFVLDSKNYERAYDLVDAIHCLPEALLNNKHWNPKVYWNVYIKPYRNKWDKTFLIHREKELVKTCFLSKFKFK